MGYGGHMWQAREVAELLPSIPALDWHTGDVVHPFANRKVEALAVALAETGGTLSVGAWHDNLNKDGLLSSRDQGLMQINLPASQCSPDPHEPSDLESRIRIFSSDPAVYLAATVANLKRAADLYVSPWPHRWFREWGAWVAATDGWAFYPEAWVSSRVHPGLWVPTGRYLHKAIRGVANAHWVAGRLTLNEALHEGERLAAFYGITKGYLFVDLVHHTDRGVQWHYPDMPTEPWSEDAYPKQNDGRSPLSARLGLP